MAQCTTCKKEIGYPLIAGLCWECHKVKLAGGQATIAQPRPSREVSVANDTGALWRLIIYVPVVAAVVFWMTYSGPYRWLAELQLNYLGRYFPALTFIATLVVIYAPLKVLLRLLTGLAPKRYATRIAQIQAASIQRPGESLLPLRALARMVVDLPRRVAIPLTLGIVCIGIGAYEQFKVWTAGSVAQVSLTQLVASGSGGARHVELTGGQFIAQQAISLSESSTTEHYVPYVLDTWQAGEPVHVFVQTNDNGLQSLPTAPSIRGLISWTGLPGPVRAGFEKMAFPPANDYVLLDATFSPLIDSAVGTWTLAIGSSLLAVALIIWGIGRWWQQRRARTALTQTTP